MKYLVRFFVIILVAFYSNTIANADIIPLVYINMEKVMNETNAGKDLVNQLEKICCYILRDELEIYFYI